MDVSASPEARELLDRLLIAHQAYFDVEREHSFAGRTFDGFAQFHSSASKYVLVKRAKLWGTSSHEYMFFSVVGQLDAQTFEDLVSFMKTDALGKVVLDDEHMNSFLTLVIIADGVDASIQGLVRRTKFRKNFQFGLKGWSDLRVCVISLSDGEVFCNAMGKDLVPTLKANAFESGAKNPSK